MNSILTIENFTRPVSKSNRILRQGISAWLLKIISSFLPAYLARSHETERTEGDILGVIASGVGDEFKSLWTFTDEKSICIGFAFAEVMTTDLGKKIVNVHHLFISSDDKTILHEFDFKVGEWGKRFGATEVGFYTRRNPEAFLRRVKNGWEFDCYVLRRKI